MANHYHYTMCGLDYVYLLSGFRRHDTVYGKGASIERVDDLDISIAIAVILRHTRLRGQELKFLRGLWTEFYLPNRLGQKHCF